MEEQIADLQRRRDACAQECERLTKELKDLEEFRRRDAIKNITLLPTSTLIDLLRIRILDPAPDWKSSIDTLVRIPTSEKGHGKKILRGGDYFEALFQLAIATGVLPQFREARINFYDSPDYKTIKPYANYLYEKSVQNSGGGEQGISDITFEVTTQSGKPYQASSLKCGETRALDSPTEARVFYFISVKGYTNEKSVAKEYDIPLLSQQLKEFPEPLQKHIVVCVRNKEQFLKRLGRTRMEFLKSSIDHVIGYDEVLDAFSTFRTNFFLRLGGPPTPDAIAGELAVLFPKATVAKPGLTLYFHQDLVVKSVLQRIAEAPPREDRPHYMCIGVLPRGGKSYIAGGIMDAHRNGRDSYTVLFLTSAVNETREQFKEDLIEKFAEFREFTFIDLVNDKKPKLGKFNFIFVSRQLSSLDTTKSKKKPKLVEEGTEVSVLSDGDLITRLQGALGALTIDLCFFDEAHIGIRSETVRDQFAKTFKQFKSPILLMSATYKNPALVLDSPDDLFVWDLQDIKDMKDLPTLGLPAFLEKTPDVVQRYPLARALLAQRLELGQTEHQIATPYLQFPMPNFISLTFTPDTIKSLKDTGLGYDYMKAFQITAGSELLRDASKQTDWGSLLVNREDALRIRQFLTPEADATDTFLVGKERKYRALNQIFSIAQKSGSRPLSGKPFSMLMFLPFGEGLPIGELCRIWGAFLLESRYWRENFVCMTLSTYAGHVPDPSMTIQKAVETGLCHREDFKGSLKTVIGQVEQAALRAGKGLILLSGDVAKMGISLKCVDIVCLMSNNSDPDDIIQKMYRALTDDPPTKKHGFIIDLNLKRIVRAMFEYDMEKSRRTATGKTLTPKERLEQLMELCNWGQDAFIQDHPEMSFDDIMNDIRQKVFARLESEVRLEYGSKTLVDKQFKIIEANPDLFREVKATLQFTTGKRSATASAETLLEQGADIPSAPVGEDTVSEAEPAPKAAPAVQALTLEQIKTKIVDIMKTFVNALVIKSDQPWSGMTFESLMTKYTADKASATRVCDCMDTQACNTTFSNLYDTAFCELRGYAMLATKKEDAVYSAETHDRIMGLMDGIFAQSGSLAPDWTAYIDSLIEDITKRSEAIPAPKGGMRRKTERKKHSSIHNNGRTTKRNHPRDD
jgi:hypothetical protein